MPAKSSACRLGLWLALYLQGSALAQPEQASMSARVVTALMPQPRSMDYGDGWLPLTGVLQIEWLGYRNSVLDEAVSRFQTYVARRTGLDLGRAGAAKLRIDCRGEDKGYLTIDARERYSLVVKGDGLC
jgi:hypothetical protein